LGGGERLFGPAVAEVFRGCLVAPQDTEPWQEQGELVSDCLMFDSAPRVPEMLGSLAREDLEGPLRGWVLAWWPQAAGRLGFLISPPASFC
jgi:hypothetical protein